MKKLFVFIFLFFLVLSSNAQLAKMSVVGKPYKASDEIVTKRDINNRFCAGIKVISDMDGFRYDAYNGVVDMKDQPGQDLVYIQPDERVLEIFHSGHEPLKIILYDHGIQLKPREVWVIKIKGKPNGVVRADEHLFEVTFNFNTNNVYCSYNQLAPILNQGSNAVFKLPKGEYTFQFEKSQYKSLSRKFAINKDQTISLNLVVDVNKRVAYRPPGIVTISSDPASAEVIINGQKMGATPCTINLTSGEYKLELRKHLHNTDRSSFTLKAGETKQLTRTLVPRFGYLAVRGTPDAANIILDGKPLGKAPIAKMELSSGKHILTARMDLFHEYREEFTIKDNDRKNILYNLKAAYGILEIKSSPEQGAEVWIDGIKKGVTPFRDERIPSGSYNVEVRKKNFNAVSETVTVSDGQTTQRVLILNSNVGTLSVKAPGARITVNGKSAAQNEFKGYLSPGKYKVKAEKTKHYSEEKDVFLSVGETEEVIFNLMPIQGSVSIMVEPQAAANANITVNGKTAGTAPKVITLLIGKYSIGVKHSDYLAKIKEVHIQEDVNKQLRFQLMSYQGSLVQKKNSWKRWKYTALATAIITAGAAVYFKMDADSKYEDYKKAMTVKDATELHKQVDQSFLYSQVGFGVSIAAVTGWIYSWIREVGINVSKY